MAKTTTGPTKEARERARTLLRRGGPYSPDEIRALDAGAPGADEPVTDLLDRQLQETAYRRSAFLAPSRSPEEIEDRARLDAAFGARTAAAERELAAAIATTETAKEKWFAARDALRAVSEVTWISGKFGHEPATGTPAQREAAEAAVADAKRAFDRAERAEQDARVAVTGIGLARAAYARALAAARTFDNNGQKV